MIFIITKGNFENVSTLFSSFLVAYKEPCRACLYVSFCFVCSCALFASRCYLWITWL